MSFVFIFPLSKTNNGIFVEFLVMFSIDTLLVRAVVARKIRLERERCASVITYRPGSLSVHGRIQNFG